MKFIDTYRDRELVLKLSSIIGRSVKRDYTFMEVCGGHTASIHRFGIPSLLPSCIRLISGPGCPVCVTAIDFIDKAIVYSRIKDFVIATFGDLVRIPGSVSSLEREKAKGADIRIVLSAREALEIAIRNPAKTVVFTAIGFETTAPGTAVTVIDAMSEKCPNFGVLSAHKLMPPAMKAIADGEIRIDGFICPGHVASITGSKIFDFLPERSGIGCVVSGFEPVDLLLSILMLIQQVNTKRSSVEIQYRRAVTREGNLTAQSFLNEVFEPYDSAWRGLGVISQSGLGLRRKYEYFDAEKRFPAEFPESEEAAGCICGNILRGIMTPGDCQYFANVCVPENPVGACMVSPEGTCNTWFKYRKYE